MFLRTVKEDSAAPVKESNQLEPVPVKEEAVIADKPDKIQSRRKSDMSAEAQLSIFLDKYLYDRFPTKEAFSEISRMYDKEQQLQGIDVQFVCPDGRVFNIDEKAQLYYLNKNIPTFAFELSFLRRGMSTLGWLCNDRLDTDMYLLIWPFADRDRCSGISWNEFTKAECYLIEKKKVLQLLQKHGLSTDEMLRRAEEIRQNNEHGKILIPGVHGIYYYASDPQKYKEAPINVVIYKGLLRAIAQRRYIVTPSDVEFL